MYKIDGTRITLTRGDSFYATVSMKVKATGEDYTPQEGDVVRFGVKRSTEDKECVIEKVIPNDTLEIYLAPDDTKNLLAGAYVYDVELTYADGNKDTFINRATFILAKEVIE